MEWVRVWHLRSNRTTLSRQCRHSRSTVVWESIRNRARSAISDSTNVCRSLGIQLNPSSRWTPETMDWWRLWVMRSKFWREMTRFGRPKNYRLWGYGLREARYGKRYLDVCHLSLNYWWCNWLWLTDGLESCPSTKQGPRITPCKAVP